MKKFKNNVGADASVRPTSKVRQNKGITLIALVITIIVMLILAAVTITMAVNGGLFEYAGNAGAQTNAAIANEQELANLESNMTVDELIDKYTEETGVDLSLVNVGDYINYPVTYTNVAAYYDGTKMEMLGGYPKSEFTGWRVLSKETNDNGTTYVRLISAGVPLTYYHYTDETKTIADLTTNFLNTEIDSSTLTVNKFYTCGFDIGSSNTLRSVFLNDFTGDVRSLTRDDLPGVDITNMSDEEYDGLYNVPTVDSYAARCWVASYYYASYLQFIGGTNGNNRVAGVRVVVDLKSDVLFSPADQQINDTPTWDISI